MGFLFAFGEFCFHLYFCLFVWLGIEPRTLPHRRVLYCRATSSALRNCCLWCQSLQGLIESQTPTAPFHEGCLWACACPRQSLHLQSALSTDLCRFIKVNANLRTKIKTKDNITYLQIYHVATPDANSGSLWLSQGTYLLTWGSHTKPANVRWEIPLQLHLHLPQAKAKRSLL